MELVLANFHTPVTIEVPEPVLEEIDISAAGDYYGRVMINEPLKLNTDLTFAQYKGLTVSDVIDIHPSYINWMILETDIPIDDGIIEYMESKDLFKDGIQPHKGHLMAKCD